MSLRCSYILLQLSSLSLKKYDQKKIVVVIKIQKINWRIPVLRIFSKIIIYSSIKVNDVSSGVSNKELINLIFSKPNSKRFSGNTCSFRFDELSATA